MSTSTQAIVTAVKAELASHLPALLTAESVPTPGAYVYGEPQLVPTTKFTIGVDCPEFDQKGAVGGQGERITTILVHAIIPGSDTETLAQYQHAYLDLIIKVLESEVTIDNAKPVVDGADTSPNFTMKGASGLFRACTVRAHIRHIRARGDS